MDVARFHVHDVELTNARARHHRPVALRENPALEQQDPMVVVRNQQRLCQDRALDALGAQARTPKRLGLHAAAGPGIGPPCFPWRTATICARIASAVSSAVWAPRSRPIGACTRSISRGSMPLLTSLATRSRWVFLLPMAPM